MTLRWFVFSNLRAVLSYLGTLMHTRHSKGDLVITRCDKNDSMLFVVLVVSPHETVSGTTWVLIRELGLL